MANLESHINGLRTFYELLKYIATDEDCLKDADWPNFYGDFQLKDLCSDNSESQEQSRLDFYSFNESFKQNLCHFISNFEIYNEVTYMAYKRNEYWVYIKNVPEWHLLNASANNLLECFILYFEELGIIYDFKDKRL